MQKGRLIDANVLTEEIKSLSVTITGLRAGKGVLNTFMNEYRKSIVKTIDEQATALEDGYELRLLKNYLSNMPKVYGKRNHNWVIVRDLLMWGTSHSGMTSCCMKCNELGIDPYGYSLEVEA